MIAAGDRLRDLREDKGKTQAEISSLLGTTQQIYSRYETNRTDLPLRHLIKLADYYQVSADYILGRTSYPKNPPEMAKPFLKNVTYVCGFNTSALIMKLAVQPRHCSEAQSHHFLLLPPASEHAPSCSVPSCLHPA